MISLRYTVRISKRALLDLETIYDYFAQELSAPKAAMDQYNRIADCIEKLEFFPNRIKLLESEPERTLGIRKITVDHYSVFFVIKQDKVIVIRVLYSRSDITKRLNQ